MNDPETLAFYQREAPSYTASDTQAPSRDLDAFLDRLPADARILELGCGAGRDAARMIERGFDVEPTDGVAAMVRKANERFGINARQMMFQELSASSEYDAIWAHASLLHLSRNQLPIVLRRVANAMKPNGLCYANYKLGSAEGRDKFGRLYNFFDADELANLYSFIPRLKIERLREYDGSGFDGVDRLWLAIIARKAAVSRPHQ